MDADVIVIGGGIAGMVAANHAARLGLRALLLEAGPRPDYLCNSRITGGVFHIAFRTVAQRSAIIEEAIRSRTFGNADPALARMIAETAPRVLPWMRREGIHFVRGGSEEYNSYMLSPPRRNIAGLDWRGRAGDVMLRTLARNLGVRGSRMMLDARATELVTEGGRVTGVVATVAGKPQSFTAGAVVIATGGFETDKALLAEFITAAPERIARRNGGGGSGDGLRMGRAVGADLVRMDGFYGHLLSRDAMHEAGLWPMPTLDNLTVAGIAVDRDGRRFADEGLGGVYLANALARLEDPLSAFSVFDHAAWRGKPGTYYVGAANPNLPRNGGMIHWAGDIETLAGKAGLPRDALAATVAAYNKAIAEGLGETLEPVRTAIRGAPSVIAVPPFYAVPMSAGITYTMGGLRIDTGARVLRPDGTPIQGLHAAGVCTGGLEGGPEAGYIGGLAQSTILGIRAAETIAQATGRNFLPEQVHA